MSNGLSYDEKGSPISRKGMITALFALAAVVVIIFGILSGGGGSTKVTGSAANGTTPPPAATCDNPSVVYFATAAPEGSNNFGPTQSVPSSSHVTAAQRKSLADTAYDRLLAKMSKCTKGGNARGDTLFTATTVAFAKHGLGLSATNVEATANTYAGNKKSWATAVKDFKASVKSYTAKHDPNEYQTLGMVPNGSKQPSLIRSNQDVKVGWALYVTFKNGTVREFRIICDIQPVGHFPHVPPPPKETTPPPPRTTPPAHHHVPPPPHTTPPPKTTPPPPPHTTPLPRTCESVYGPGYLGTYPNCRKSAVDSSGSPVVPPPPASAPGTNPAPVAVPTTDANGHPTTEPTSSQCYDPTTGLPVSSGTAGAWCS